MEQILLNGLAATLAWDPFAGEGEQYVEVYRNGERVALRCGDVVEMGGRKFRLDWAVGAWSAGYILVK